MTSRTAEVQLNVYDLSQGMARQMSPMLLGKQIDGIWHTGVVAFGTEYYFGGGICADAPGTTPYGMPVETVQLGNTSKTQGEFLAFLASVSSKFSMQTYHLLDNNCNNFSDACAKFLLGNEKGIPEYIIDLPRQALDSPLGPMIRPMLDNMQGVIRDQSAGHEVQLGSSSSMPSSPAPSTSARSGAASSTEKSAIASAVAAPPRLHERANRAAILQKLRELDPAFPEPTDALPEPENDVATLLLAVKRLPAQAVFPALDLLRIAVLASPEASKVIAVAVPDLLKRYVTSPGSGAASDVPRPATMMALRVALNCFKHPAGAQELMSSKTRSSIVDAAADALGHEHPLVTKTAAALTFNVTRESLRAGTGKSPSGVGNGHNGTAPLAASANEGLKSLSEEETVRLLFAAGERMGNSAAVIGNPDEDYLLLATMAMLVRDDPDSKELLRTVGVDLDSLTDSTAKLSDGSRAMALELQRILQKS